MVSRGFVQEAGKSRRKRLSRAAVAIHQRLLAEADRALAAADVQFARGERVIQRVRRELAAARRAA